MARSKKRRRDTSDIATRSVPLSVNRLVPRPVLSLEPGFRRARALLSEIEDRRTYHPDGPRRPARSFLRSRHRLTDLNKKAPRSRANRTALSNVSGRLAFQGPENVLVCVRRNMRRQVMFAKKKTGRRGQRPPRRNWFSSISCKRRK